jgi:hypothetical protein
MLTNLRRPARPIACFPMIRKEPNMICTGKILPTPAIRQEPDGRTLAVLIFLNSPKVVMVKDLNLTSVIFLVNFLVVEIIEDSESRRVVTLQ